MDFVFTFVLGVVQGLTEFLPVSSTGHLILIERYFQLSSSQFGLSFDIALHLGTLFALLIYFRHKLVKLLVDFVKGERKLVYLLFVATVPALFFGLLLEPFIRSSLRTPFLIALNLFFFSFLFLYCERKSKQEKSYQQMSFFDAFLIGLFQAIALFPGVSRSGITISGGLLRNLKKEEAGEFAFLLSIPIIFIASGKDMVDLISSGLSLNYFSFFIFGAFTSFLVGFLTIKYFLLYLKKGGFFPFVIYRIILALIILYLFK